MSLTASFLSQWEVVKQAPLVILPAIIILAGLIGVGEYLLLKANIDRKDDLISTLKEQLTAARDAAAKSQEVTAKLASAAQRPELRLNMVGGSVFRPNMPDQQNLRTGITLDATVWNTGAPSVATAWSLVVIPVGQMPVLGQLTKMADQIRAQGSINSDVIRASDALDAKTKKDPIGDIPIDGKLLFYIPLSQQIVLAPTTVLELSVKDIYGAETTVRQVMGDWWQR